MKRTDLIKYFCDKYTTAKKRRNDRPLRGVNIHTGETFKIPFIHPSDRFSLTKKNRNQQD
ncbi:hypothetical protein CR194_19165 [Salipaludibacillus keqinensis]|uniref:Uncharacterized protein n=1 Tax=Salipaludibacillus keqinensis TaxID=2045207 RepID=A0A323TGQ9_9BACI|nr:hypothetical protein CR194_19165 [Salipaludibacillus keqinensis]